MECEDIFSVDVIQERTKKLLKDNEPERGGSFYLQCKILGAQKALLDNLGFIVDPDTGELKQKP